MVTWTGLLMFSSGERWWMILPRQKGLASYHLERAQGPSIGDSGLRSTTDFGQPEMVVHPPQRPPSIKAARKLIHTGQLFTFLDPPEGFTQDLKATTNLLEGGINKQLKDLAGNHRGMFDEHQRITMDWWLFTHTEDPVAPLELAKQQDFGRQGEKAARAAWAQEERKRRGHPDGRPATFDTHIDNEWNPSLGIRKGGLRDISCG